jgi:hypothetical protein
LRAVAGAIIVWLSLAFLCLAIVGTGVGIGVFIAQF